MYAMPLLEVAQEEGVAIDWPRRRRGSPGFAFLLRERLGKGLPPVTRRSTGGFNILHEKAGDTRPELIIYG
jgi:hypothetical protein